MEVKAIRLFFVRIRTGHEKFTRIAIFKKLKINWGIPNFQGQAGMKIYQFHKFVTLWKSKTHLTCLKWLQPTNFMSSLKLPKFNFHAARWTIEGNMDIGTGKTLTILSKNCVLIIIFFSSANFRKDFPSTVRDMSLWSFTTSIIQYRAIRMSPCLSKKNCRYGVISPKAKKFVIEITQKP